LAGSGYRSLQTGKWWQGNYRRGGFTDGMTTGDVGARHGDRGLEIGRKGMQPIADFLADCKRERKPFFLWYAPMLPHQPHNPPERLLAKYRDRTSSLHIAKYWAMCEWFDETCGELRKLLAAHGFAANTMIVYVADNGWIQDPDRPRFDPRSKQSPYDGGLRTPIMVHWPEKVKPTRIATPVSSLDLYTTVLRATGSPRDPQAPGIDLLEDEAVAKRGPVFGACFLHTAKTLDDAAANLRWRWVVQGRRKLVVPFAENEPHGKIELFDLIDDPHERTDLANRESAAVRELVATLDGWWTPKDRPSR
jgi:uncharacterized sulfatase